MPCACWVSGELWLFLEVCLFCNFCRSRSFLLLSNSLFPFKCFLSSLLQLWFDVLLPLQSYFSPNLEFLFSYPVARMFGTHRTQVSAIICARVDGRLMGSLWTGVSCTFGSGIGYFQYEGTFCGATDCVAVYGVRIMGVVEWSAGEFRESVETHL